MLCLREKNRGTEHNIETVATNGAEVADYYIRLTLTFPGDQ